jgi:hypothetical protein
MQVSNPQTFNRYSYTGNDLVNRTDSSGMDWVAEASNSYAYRIEPNDFKLTTTGTPMTSSGRLLEGCSANNG